ncbi:MAG TPA: response regulator, partial [Salinimicrobium sp.]|nr:response regulator [Salinimicrobium sp.]
KFTEKGSVIVTIEKPDSKTNFQELTLPKSEVLKISVKDTGIGIPEAKRMMIFEAFQQAEGGISRQYGGTGLGLTISRELARLLGGEIHIESKEGKGSLFTVYIPLDLTSAPIKEMDEAISSYEEPKQAGSGNIEAISFNDAKSQDIIKTYIPDDRDNLKTNDHSLLVIDHDKSMAQLMRRLAQKFSFKLLFGRDGKEGMKLAVQYQPDGILLSEQLSDMKGLIVLDHLKFNLKTRHIPVYLMAEEEKGREAVNKGALGFNPKPVSAEDIEKAIQKIQKTNQSPKELLLVQNDETKLKSIKNVLDSKEVKISTAATAEEAMDKLKSKTFDCVVLGLNLPDTSLLESIKNSRPVEKGKNIPIVIYSGKELTKAQQKVLPKSSDGNLIKAVASPEALLDEVFLILHVEENKFTSAQKKIMANLHDPKHVLKGKKVLVVDDDSRNSYALSKALADAGMKVIVAENGKVAYEKLEKEKNVDIVLMDVMMPILDGYEATTKIRKKAAYKNLPIVSLTAKAMPEDKAKSFEAGANDYLTKPVNIDKLLDIVRLWLYQ